MQPRSTVEAQYGKHLEIRDREGVTRLGVEKNGNWQTDPRRLVFVLSRYKFVSKMLSGRQSVLEVGCGDAWPVRIVLQEVARLHAIDIDPIFVEDAKTGMTPRWPFTVAVHDMLSGPLPAAFDAAYSLDVIEHIPRTEEHLYLRNLRDSLTDDGVLIVGSPSLESGTVALRRTPPMPRMGWAASSIGRSACTSCAGWAAGLRRLRSTSRRHRPH